MPPALFSFLNIFKTKKGVTLPFQKFQLLLTLNVSAKFLAKILIGSRVIVVLSEGYRKIQKKKEIQKFYFFLFETTFFAKYFKNTLYRSDKYGLFLLKSHFLIFAFFCLGAITLQKVPTFTSSGRSILEKVVMSAKMSRDPQYFHHTFFKCVRWATLVLSLKVTAFIILENSRWGWGWHFCLPPLPFQIGPSKKTGYFKG